MAETVAYNVIVHVAKATTQPATETDILKHACDFIIYKLERGAGPLWWLRDIYLF